jgi:hypothetical protein
MWGMLGDMSVAFAAQQPFFYDSANGSANTHGMQVVSKA